MKIGSVDIGIPVLINAVACVGAGVALLVLWNKGTDLRYEAFYRDKIIRGLADGLPERRAEGINACLDFLKHEPSHVPARLYLASIYAQDNNHVAARTEFETIAKLPNATALEKAIALNGAGVAVFRAAPKESRAQAVAEAENLLRQSMDADRAFADAQANLALLQPYKTPDGWHAAAEPLASSALTAPLPPTAEALENVYRLMGVIQQEKKQAGPALAAFDASQAIRPAGATGSTGNDQMRRLTKLSGVVQKGLPADVRRAQILEIERSMPTMGDRPQQSIAATAMGIAWMELRGEEDWGTNGYSQAVRTLLRAIDYDPKNRLAYDNLSALYDLRIEDYAKQLKGPVTSFSGVTPPPDVIKEGIRARRIQLVDRTPLVEIRRILREQEDLWRRFLDKGFPTEDEKATAKLQLMITMRRQAYTMDTDEEATQKPVLDRALIFGKEVEARDPDNGLVNFSVGMLLLDMKKYSEANVRFQKAQSKGFKAPVLDQILEELSRKPEMIGARPAEGQRWFGSRPLVSATLYAPNAAEGFRAIEMTHNGQAVPAMLLGSQVLYLPEPTRLTDGKHQIQISVTEAISLKKIDFPPLEFTIDKLPPSWKLSPDGGEVDGKAIFTISLNDPTGVDLASVRVLYRSMDNAKNPTNREIVVSGRYKIGAPDQGIKGNSTIPGESFKVSAGSIPLPPGGYVLDITAKDLTGNEMKASKNFQVK